MEPRSLGASNLSLFRTQEVVVMVMKGEQWAEGMTCTASDPFLHPKLLPPLQIEGLSLAWGFGLVGGVIFNSFPFTN